MNITRFKLAFEQRDSQGANEYIIMTKKGCSAGLITFKVSADTIFVLNVYVHEQFKQEIKITNWFRQFKHIYAYQVTKEAISYWTYIGADIKTLAGENKFEDLVFTEKELYEN